MTLLSGEFQRVAHQRVAEIDAALLQLCDERLHRFYIP